MTSKIQIPTDNRCNPKRGPTQAANEKAVIRAKDIMTTDIVWVEPEKTVREIALLLTNKKISAVPVIDDGEIVGIVSEGDLIRRQELGTETSVAGQRSSRANIDYAKSHGMRASDVMTRNVVTVSEDTSLAEIAETLQTGHIKRVPVTREAELVGIVSRSDIVRVLAARPEGANEPMSSDDDIIRFKVIETLMSIPGTSPWLATVSVLNGIVELNCTVQDEAAKEPSRIAVEKLPNVIEVKDKRSVLQPY